MTTVLASGDRAGALREELQEVLDLLKEVGKQAPRFTLLLDQDGVHHGRACTTRRLTYTKQDLALEDLVAPDSLLCRVCLVRTHFGGALALPEALSLLRDLSWLQRYEEFAHKSTEDFRKSAERLIHLRGRRVEVSSGVLCAELAGDVRTHALRASKAVAADLLGRHRQVFLAELAAEVLPDDSRTGSLPSKARSILEQAYEGARQSLLVEPDQLAVLSKPLTNHGLLDFPVLLLSVSACVLTRKGDVLVGRFPHVLLETLRARARHAVQASWSCEGLSPEGVETVAVLALEGAADGGMTLEQAVEVAQAL